MLHRQYLASIIDPDSFRTAFALVRGPRWCFVFPFLPIKGWGCTWGWIISNPLHLKAPLEPYDLTTPDAV